MGTRTVTAVVKGSFQCTVNNLLSDGTKAPTVEIGVALSATLGQGTGSGQADRAWSEYSRSLATGLEEDLDMFDLGTRDVGAGAGLDSMGQSWAISEVVGILIYNAGPGVLTVKPQTGNGWTALLGATGTHDIGAGGFLQAYNPADPALVVTDTTNHSLNFEASGGTCVYDVHLIARSA
jgi:hypothetical protein